MKEVEEDFRLKGYNREGYDYTSARYSMDSMKYYSYLRSVKLSNLLRKNLSQNKTNNILDVGCGTGLLLKHLTSLDKKNNFFGLDFSKNMLDNTIIFKNTLQRVKLVQGSAFELPFPNENFEAVICTRFIHQYSNNLKGQLIKEMKRVLKPGGLLIIEFYSFIPRLIRYPFSFYKIQHEEYFKHTTTEQELEILIGKKYIRENLILPFPNFLSILLGLDNFKRLCKIIPKIGLSSLIDQYLISTRK